MQVKDCYFVGTITRKHGLKGHVLLKLDTDEPNLYYNLESILIEINENLVPFFIKECTVIQEDVIRILLEESTISIETVIQKKAYLPLSQLPKLQGNKFYFHEIIDFQLQDKGMNIGQIVEILDNTAQPLFVVQSEDKNFVIPIINDWILEVNREFKYINMELPEGITSL